MKPDIYIVDDDTSILRAMKRLIKSANMVPHTFSSAQEFLDFDYEKQNVCLIVDIRMPGMNGLDLQDELCNRGDDLPVIFITGFDSPDTRENPDL